MPRLGDNRGIGEEKTDEKLKKTFDKAIENFPGVLDIQYKA